MIKITDKMIQGWVRQAETWMEDEDMWDGDTFDIEIEEIAAGALGTHQPSKIAKSLQLSIPDDAQDPEVYNWDEDEYAWEEIELRTDELADTINNMSDFPGRFYFGSDDADGSYGLRYTVDKDELDNSVEEPEFSMSDESVDKVVDKLLDTVK